MAKPETKRQFPQWKPILPAMVILLVFAICVGMVILSGNRRRLATPEEMSAMFEAGLPPEFRDRLPEIDRRLRDLHAQKVKLKEMDTAECRLMAWRLHTFMNGRDYPQLVTGEQNFLHEDLWWAYDYFGSRLCAEAVARLPLPLVSELEVPFINPNSLDYGAMSYPFMDGSVTTEPLARRLACGVFENPAKWSAEPVYPDMPRHVPSSIDFPPQPYYLLRYFRARVSLTEEEHAQVLNGYKYYGHDPSPLTQQMEIDERLFWAESSAPGHRLRDCINNLIAYHNGSHAAYTNLIQEDVDLILVDRAVSSAERQEIMDRGVVLESSPVARDALVFIANDLNPLDGLTSEQLRSIYTGEATRWSDVGGFDAPVCVYLANPGEYAYDSIRTCLLGGGPVAVTDIRDFEGRLVPPDYYGRLDEKASQTIDTPFYAVLKDERGLAATSHFFARYLCVSPLTKILAVDGVEPTNETIADGSYPFVTEIYAVTHKDLPEGHGARKLRDWLLSGEGQAFIAESGYVPLSNW